MVQRGAFGYSLSLSSPHGIFLLFPFPPFLGVLFPFSTQIGCIHILSSLVCVYFISQFAGFWGWFSEHKLYDVYESLCFYFLLALSLLVLFAHCLFFRSFFLFSFSFKVQGFSAISFHFIFGHHQLYRAFRWGFLVIRVLYICMGVGLLGSGRVDRGKDVVKKRNISILIFMRNASIPVVAAKYDTNFAYSFYFPYLQSLQVWCCTVYHTITKVRKEKKAGMRVIRVRPSTPDGLAPEYVFNKNRVSALYFTIDAIGSLLSWSPLRRTWKVCRSALNFVSWGPYDEV